MQGSVLNGRQFVRTVLLAMSVISLLSCALEKPPAREAREPEAATGYIEKQAVVSRDYMVVSANPYATDAGQKVIEKGGSAIDAAIAVQAMLTLVEPQSSGIGGGTFILYWDNKQKQLHTYDGRETAPSLVDENLFMQDGKAMNWRDAVVGGKSVGVPGVLSALHMAHGEFGKLPWQSLFSQSIETARKGFTVSPRLHKLVALNIHPGLQQFSAANDYFFPGGQPLAAGTLKKNPALAATLQQIAEQGVDYFYHGELAHKMAMAVQNAPINPGVLRAHDFNQYTTIKRQPVCGEYRSYKVCGMAPPSSGGVNVLQILKTLEPFDVGNMLPNSADFIHLYSQASALAYADRDLYIADTDFTALAYEPLISDTYLQSRSEFIGLNKPMRKFVAGNPYESEQLGADNALELPNTSHISIVDKQGNAISMTSSIEFMFGSGIMVEGFLLNNQMTDFSFKPLRDGKPVLNRIEPDKRPRSAMSPTMVFDRNSTLSLVVGSPGGSRIISYVAQTLIGVLDWELDIQQAINLPKITNRNDYTALEKHTPVVDAREQLEALGHNVKVIDLNSGLHGIEVSKKHLVGGADPRREGRAVGR